MLSEGLLRLGTTLTESLASSKIADVAVNQIGIKNPIGKLAVNVAASSVIDQGISMISNPIKAGMGIDKDMEAHSAAGKNFRNAIRVASVALPFVMSDTKSLQKFWPVLPILGGGLMLYGYHANQKEQQERKRLGLLNHQGSLLNKIKAR